MKVRTVYTTVGERLVKRVKRVPESDSLLSINPDQLSSHTRTVILSGAGRFPIVSEELLKRIMVAAARNSFELVNRSERHVGTSPRLNCFRKDCRVRLRAS